MAPEVPGNHYMIAPLVDYYPAGPTPCGLALSKIWAEAYCPCNVVSLKGQDVLKCHTLDIAPALTVNKVIAEDKLWEKGDCLLELHSALMQ